MAGRVSAGLSSDMGLFAESHFAHSSTQGRDSLNGDGIWGRGCTGVITSYILGYHQWGGTDPCSPPWLTLHPHPHCYGASNCLPSGPLLLTHEAWIRAALEFGRSGSVTVLWHHFHKGTSRWPQWCCFWVINWAWGWSQSAGLHIC